MLHFNVSLHLFPLLVGVLFCVAVVVCNLYCVLCMLYAYCVVYCARCVHCVYIVCCVSCMLCILYLYMYICLSSNRLQLSDQQDGGEIFQQQTCCKETSKRKAVKILLLWWLGTTNCFHSDWLVKSSFFYFLFVVVWSGWLISVQLIMEEVQVVVVSNISVTVNKCENVSQLIFVCFCGNTFEF